jgi:hypothetical protein
MTNTRTALAHRINALLTFDTNGTLCDRAMGLMRQHRVTADELNAERASLTRRHYVAADAR